MQPIDVGTLLLVYQILAAMVLAFMVAGAWHARSLEALWLWTAGFAAVWVSQLIRLPIVELWGYRASLPVGHIGALLHAALLALGVRSFLRLRPRVWLVLLPTAAAAAASLASVYILRMRPGWSLAVTQIAAGLLLAASAYTALQAHRRSRHATLRIMAVVLGISALVAAARGGTVVSALLFPIEATPLEVDRANAPWLLATLMLLVAQGFAILLLVNGAMQREVQALADLDPLTGLLNRRGLSTGVERLRQQISLGGGPGLAVAVIDLDHFKAVNDHYGHDAGDQLLVGIARRLRSIVRPQDLVARFGGEEFVLVLHDVPPDMLESFAERVREAVSGVSVETEVRSITATISMGIATMLPSEGLSDAVRRADQALYRAKREGRNRIAFADPMAAD